MNFMCAMMEELCMYIPNWDRISGHRIAEIFPINFQKARDENTNIGQLFRHVSIVTEFRHNEMEAGIFFAFKLIQKSAGDYGGLWRAKIRSDSSRKCDFTKKLKQMGKIAILFHEMYFQLTEGSCSQCGKELFSNFIRKNLLSRNFCHKSLIENFNNFFS